jgi:ORF6N domain
MAVGKAASGKVEDITRAILVLRGRRVLLDAELAVLYGVTTRRLNEQVRRNRKRFPGDFLFELTTEEFANLKSRFATSSWGGRRKRPLAFTEHGAIQAATILNSPRAVEMSVYVVRAFVKLREVLSTNRELARRFEQLESRLDSELTDHDEAIAAILSAIRELMRPRDPPRRGIGFTAKLADDS